MKLAVDTFVNKVEEFVKMQEAKLSTLCSQSQSPNEEQAKD
jgi:hypothetical protein